MPAGLSQQAEWGNMKYTLTLLVAYLIGCVYVLMGLQQRDAAQVMQEAESIRRELANEVLIAHAKGEKVLVRDTHLRDAAPYLVAAYQDKE